MLRPHMFFAAMLATSLAAVAAEPKPEIRRQPGAAQAIGAVHTLRVIPEACARLEGRFTGDAKAPYAFAAVRTLARTETFMPM